MVDREEGDRSAAMSRRRFLAVQSLVLAGVAAGCSSSDRGEGSPTPTGSPAIPTGTAAATPDGRSSVDPVTNTVAVAPDEAAATAVSDQLFGRLNEHYAAGTIYPGVYSEHVKNNAFYPWFEEAPPKTFFDPATIENHDGIPFPWEPVGEAGFERREGGVAGGEEAGYQRVSVDGTRGGIAQKIVLPDFRTLEYDLAFSVRGEGVGSVTAAITTLGGAVLASADVDVTGGWTRREVGLALDRASDDQFDAGGAGVETPYGEYRLAFAAEGSGRVDLDWVMLRAGDAIDGRFNPSTVELLRESDTTWLKWPGGNFASQYRWRDGVGPLGERPVRRNRAWGGLEPNYFGTGEYLDLCELAGLTPRITVGWWSGIGPEEAAAWVEYCNGSTDTGMGGLRAEHGHPEPYGVTDWEVGNEVYGPWQYGHTSDPSVFASGGGPGDRAGFDDYYDAMTAVDGDISVYADAMSPMYRDPDLPDPEAWNATLFEEAGDRLDGVNVHHYSWGIRDDARRRQWYEDHTAGTPEPGYWEYSEVLISFPTQFGVLLEELAAKAAEAGVEGFEINVGEWGLFPAVDGPYPGPETMPGGAYFAGMLNAFIRQSEHVRKACNTWVPVKMFPPEFVEFPPDPNPLAPAGTVHALYAGVLEGEAEWHAAGVDVTGASRTIPETGDRIRRMEGVPYVDAAAVRTADGSELAVFLTNRNLRAPGAVSLELGADVAGAPVAITRLEAAASERPLPHAFQTDWGSPDAYEVTRTTGTVGDDGTLDLDLGPAGVARALVDRDGDGPAAAGDVVRRGIDGVSGEGRPYTADGG